MINRIDHIAIGTASLEQGVTALKDILGHVLPAGGKHDQMGTHNCLTQAGNNRYIELIAIDPDAPDPGHPRWFTLDNPSTQARLAERPRALSWVVHTSNLDEVIAHSPVDLGEVLDLTRGSRSWRLTVPRDGSLHESGLLPAFIEWPPGPHPSTGMQDQGIELQHIHLGHPDPDHLDSLLRALNIAHLVKVHKSSARALSFSLKNAAGEMVTID